MSVTVDTFDNGGGEVGLEIRWKGQRVSFVPVPKDDPGNGIFLRKSRFVDASFEVLPNGLLLLLEGFDVSPQLVIGRRRLRQAERRGQEYQNGQSCRTT